MARQWMGWLVMTVFMLAFWGFVIWAVVAVVRTDRTAARPVDDPEAMLARRLAAGEIDEDEYRARLHALQEARPGPTRGTPSSEARSGHQ